MASGFLRRRLDELAQNAETLKELRTDGINEKCSKKQGELLGEEIFQYGRRMHSRKALYGAAG